MTKTTSLALSLALTLGGCLQTVPSANVRICDDKGCSDRPRDTATFDTTKDDNPEETRRLATLKDIAAKDPRAAYDLGIRLMRGDGVRMDSYQAIQWLRQAGERGDLRAQAARSGCYQSPQPFHPHITLLRDAGQAVAIPPPGFHWAFPVNAFALYESVFAQGRTRYTPLQRWTLGNTERNSDEV